MFLVWYLLRFRVPYASVDDVEGDVSFVEYQIAFAFVIELRREADAGHGVVARTLPCSAFPACVDNGLDHVEANAVKSRSLKYGTHFLC